MKDAVVAILFAVLMLLLVEALLFAWDWEYKTEKPRHYEEGGQIYLQEGYTRRDGTYVEPHFKTKPDEYEYNNLNQNKKWWEE